MKSKESKAAARSPKYIKQRLDSPPGRSRAEPNLIIPPQLRSWVRTIVVMLTLLTFLPVLKNGFVDWDTSTLVDNFSYRGLGLGELEWIIASFHFGHYQPLVWLTFAFDYDLWWLDPFGYHWTSVLLHIASTVVFYHIALQLLSGAPAIKGRTVSGPVEIAAGLAALVFAVHPLRVEPVAWVSGRAEILSALFVLLSLYFYLRAIDFAESVLPSKASMRVSIAAFVCSLLAGPVGIMLPFILLILDNYPLRRASGLPSPFTSHDRRLYWEKTPYFLAVIVFCSVNWIARVYEPAVALFYNADIKVWTFHQLAAPAFYIWKAIIPVGLSPAYELQDWLMAVFVLASVLMCAAAIALRKRSPAFFAAWLCYLVFLLPAFRGNFPAQQILADRYTYLAALPWSLLVGIGAVRVCGSEARARLQIWLGVGFAASLLTAIGVLTWVQIPMWQDAETLWKKAAVASSSGRAYFNLATLFEAQDKYDEAVSFYRRVVEIDPQRWQAHERVALLLQKRGNIAEAVEHYKMVIQFNPLALEARDNLAAGLVYLGHSSEAEKHFRKLLELAPERNQARIKLGTILAVEGRIGEAAEVLEAAVRADPSDGKILLRLGQVLAAQRKFNEAARHLRDATRLLPNDAEAHESFGSALLELGKKEEATVHLREALKILRSTPAAR